MLPGWVVGCGAAPVIAEVVEEPTPAVSLMVDDRQIPVLGVRLREESGVSTLTLSATPLDCDGWPRGPHVRIHPGPPRKRSLTWDDDGQAYQAWWKGTIGVEGDELALDLRAALRSDLPLVVSGRVRPLRCGDVGDWAHPGLEWREGPPSVTPPPVGLPWDLAGVWSLDDPAGAPGPWVHLTSSDTLLHTAFVDGPWSSHATGARPTPVATGRLEQDRVVLRRFDQSVVIRLWSTEPDVLEGLLDGRSVHLRRWLPVGARLRPSEAVARALADGITEGELVVAWRWADDGTPAWDIRASDGSGILVDAATGRIAPR